MRILILSNVPPGSVGGAEVQALLLAHRWVAMGHEVVIAGYANQPLSSKDFRIIRIPTLRNNRPLRAISYLSATLWLLWRHKKNYDLIYCRFLKEQTFTACLAKYLFGLPQPLVACPASTSAGGDAEHALKSPLKWILLKLLRNHVTNTNAMSNRIKQEVLALGIPHNKISSIPNGIILPTLKPKQCSHDNTVRIIFVGRLVKEKGLDILLEAAHMLKKSCLCFKIKIVGNGPLRSALEEQRLKSGLNGYVEFIGELKPDEISKQLTEADIFVLPSRREGFPGALLEAIAHGLPAVATRVSGSEEIIDDNIGWLIPVNDPAALANALKQAISLSHEELKTMEGKARQKAAHQYDINQVANRYLQLFEQLTNS